jgi:predicted transposase/invertase (TIGR01784 family)
MLKEEVFPGKAYRRALALYDEIIAEWREEARQEIMQEARQEAIREVREQWFAQGIQEGIQEGLDQGKREIIKRGHANGVPIATLSLLTGYSEAEVLRLIETDDQS